MPKYKANLEVEIVCPVDHDKPELTITLKELLESLRGDMGLGGGYAVCVKNNPKKLTASMRIKHVMFAPCENCGAPLDFEL